MNKFILTLLSVFISLLTFAQGESAETSNNFMLSNHKVFVSVAVLALILVILFVFLLWIERRLKQLEDSQKS
jgi:hypothetical protein